MPEGPEVRILAEWMNRRLINSHFLSMRLDLGGPINTRFRASAGCYSRTRPLIGGVQCEGKFIYLQLKPDCYLGCHLGQTGWWSGNAVGSDIHGELRFQKPNKQISTLYYHDQRHFGKFYWLSSSELERKLGELGPDVFYISQREFSAALASSAHHPIAVVLADQHLMSGIGNYLRAEILYHAKIFPLTRVDQLSASEIQRLYRSVRLITQRVYNAGGTSTHAGNIGGYHLLVYGRAADPKGRDVRTLRLAGRTIYYVPAVQKPR